MFIETTQEKEGEKVRRSVNRGREKKKALPRIMGFWGKRDVDEVRKGKKRRKRGILERAATNLTYNRSKKKETVQKSKIKSRHEKSENHQISAAEKREFAKKSMIVEQPGRGNLVDFAGVRAEALTNIISTSFGVEERGLPKSNEGEVRLEQKEGRQ